MMSECGIVLRTHREKKLTGEGGSYSSIILECLSTQMAWFGRDLGEGGKRRSRRGQQVRDYA
jgi:hypothetical protein